MSDDDKEFREAVQRVLPWIRHLPPNEWRTVTDDLVAAVIRAHDLGSDATMRALTELASWKSTAEVHADPELARALSSVSLEDFDPVSRPGTECPSNTPDDREPDRAHWCILAPGHEGKHQSRDRYEWTDEDAELRRPALYMYWDQIPERSDPPGRWTYVGSCSCGGQDLSCAEEDESWMPSDREAYAHWRKRSCPCVRTAKAQKPCPQGRCPYEWTEAVFEAIEDGNQPLPCGLCRRENGEEVHPYPECPMGEEKPKRTSRLLRALLPSQRKGEHEHDEA